MPVILPCRSGWHGATVAAAAAVRRARVIACGFIHMGPARRLGSRRGPRPGPRAAGCDASREKPGSRFRVESDSEPTEPAPWPTASLQVQAAAARAACRLRAPAGPGDPTFKLRGEPDGGALSPSPDPSRDRARHMPHPGPARPRYSSLVRDRPGPGPPSGLTRARPAGAPARLPPVPTQTVVRPGHTAADDSDAGAAAGACDHGSHGRTSPRPGSPSLS